MAWRCVAGTQRKAWTPAADCVPSARSTIKHRLCCASLCLPCLWFLGEGWGPVTWCPAQPMVWARRQQSPDVWTEWGLLQAHEQERVSCLYFCFKTWGHFVVMVSLSPVECVSCGIIPTPADPPGHGPHSTQRGWSGCSAQVRSHSLMASGCHRTCPL